MTSCFTEVCLHRVLAVLRGAVPCFAGSFNEIHGSETCLPCPVGSYQEEPAGTACFNCPAGKTTNSTGAVSVDECVDDVSVTDGKYRPTVCHYVTARQLIILTLIN